MLAADVQQLRRLRVGIDDRAAGVRDDAGDRQRCKQRNVITPEVLVLFPFSRHVLGLLGEAFICCLKIFQCGGQFLERVTDDQLCRRRSLGASLERAEAAERFVRPDGERFDSVHWTGCTYRRHPSAGWKPETRASRALRRRSTVLQLAARMARNTRAGVLTRSATNRCGSMNYLAPLG